MVTKVGYRWCWCSSDGCCVVMTAVVMVEVVMSVIGFIFCLVVVCVWFVVVGV